jgi:predicted Zn finger-like uncharacterized protein
MEMMIHCPMCQARLTVPEKAAGHSVRCPQCKKPFKVPSDNEIVEETITCWLEMEAEQEKVLEEKKAQELLSLSPLDELPEYVPDSLEDASGSTEQETAGASSQAKPTATAAAPSKAAGPAKASRSDGAAKPTSAILDPESTDLEAVVQEALDDVAPASRPADDEQATIVVQPSVPRAGANAALAGGAGQRQPRLHIKEMLPTGVRFGFDAHLLKRPSFRAALPTFCIACGKDDPAHLMARPLVWADRIDRPGLPADQIETSSAVPFKAHGTGRQVAAAMGQLQGLPSPFNLPVPYYICEGCAPKWRIHCHTHAEPHGIVCEVVVPSVPYALAWLGRVNGICGDDYAQLESFTPEPAGDDAWLALPEQVRTRITGWFEQGRDERFLLYLKDSDYPKADSGLGGLVITSRRLVFCKYHRHGAIRLNDSSTRLVAAREGPFDDLICIREGSKGKLVRLRPDDTERLAEALKELGAVIQVERGEPATAKTA